MEHHRRHLHLVSKPYSLNKARIALLSYFEAGIAWLSFFEAEIALLWVRYFQDKIASFTLKIAQNGVSN